MREVYGWEFRPEDLQFSWVFAPEELRLIKSALMGKINQKSPHWEKAQSLASKIPAEPIHYNYNNRQEGLTDDIFRALLEIGQSSTAAEIEEYLGLPKPNSVSAICSKLARQGLLGREEVEQERKGKGVSARHKYFIKSERSDDKQAAI